MGAWWFIELSDPNINFLLKNKIPSSESQQTSSNSLHAETEQTAIVFATSWQSKIESNHATQAF